MDGVDGVDAESMVATVLARVPNLDPRTAAAFRAVPRHLFLPGVPADQAYRDAPVVTRRDEDGHPISSSSQPTIMAIMLDQLGLEPGHRVLEIGAGTGYNAALMAHLVGPDGLVVSLDLDVAGVADNLAAAGYGQVTVVQRDGALGYAERAPFDRIIATVGVWELAPAWFAQLVPGGRLVVPLDLRGMQRSVAFERDGQGLVSRSMVPCGFMRMRGPSSGPPITRMLNQDTDLVLTAPGLTRAGAVDAEGLLAALRSPGQQIPTAASTVSGIDLWLAVTEPDWCQLSEVDGPASLLTAPAASLDRWHHTVGIALGASAALLTRPAGAGALTATGYGPDGTPLARRLADHVSAWREAGSPTTESARITAYPAADAPARPEGVVLDTPNTRLHLAFPTGP